VAMLPGPSEKADQAEAEAQECGFFFLRVI